MRTSSDAVFHTDRFRHDVRQYMKLTTTSYSETAAAAGLQSETFRRFIDGDNGSTLHVVVKLAQLADLKIDDYTKTDEEQYEWKMRNMTGIDRGLMTKARKRESAAA
jgi:hypothetical protein